jgi:hypothetical protein
VSSEFRDFIDGHGDHIARPTITRKHAELQDRINILTQMKPHDLLSFVISLRYRVAQRGLASYTNIGTYRPFMGWLELVSESGGNVLPQTLTRWRNLTSHIVRLQHKITHTSVAAHGNILREAIAKVKEGDRDYAQYVDLCRLIPTRPVSQLLFDCECEETRREEYQTYPTVRLTQVKARGNRGVHVLNPFCSPDSVAQLALPRLPRAKFCYYVEEDDEWWCRSVLGQQSPLSAMEKAALLEAVKIF